MNRTSCFAAMLLTGIAGSGCLYSGNFCEEYVCAETGGAGGASTTTMSSSNSSTMMSSTSSITAECDPLKLTADASISATCGIFVEPGPAGGAGTQTAPYGTLAEALTANPMNLPIYVCSTGAGLDEAATLSASERLLGGVTCGEWKASATKTAWTAQANATPLTLSTTTGALVQSFAITSAAASNFDGATLQGNSSIAVIADNATATFENVDIVAGAGAPGGEAMDQSGQAPGRNDMPLSFDGVMGGTCSQAGGGPKLFSTCPAGGGTTEGGKGGDGALGNGSPGTGGLPFISAAEPNGTPGNGDTGAGGWSCGGANLGNGESGNDGVNGTPAPMASAAGNLTAAGYLGAAGGAGPNGGVGQGGGGGGGRKGDTFNGCGSMVKGPSGGSGGAGGCGGLGGEGGGAGGASIALASINSALTLTNVHLTATSGGNGGAGGDGQIGGDGGAGAFGGAIGGCQGGSGGKGGDGAGGGGGKGGPSIGLASVGPAAAPAIDDGNITVSASPATGGAAGGGNVPGNTGGAGDLMKKAPF